MVLEFAFTVLLIFIFLRVPIAVATGLVGICGLATFQGWTAAFSQVGIIATETVLTYEFAVISLFIVMGNLFLALELPKNYLMRVMKWSVIGVVMLPKNNSFYK